LFARLVVARKKRRDLLVVVGSVAELGIVVVLKAWTVAAVVGFEAGLCSVCWALTMLIVSSLGLDEVGCSRGKEIRCEKAG
jgi:hypothetical protein